MVNPVRQRGGMAERGETDKHGVREEACDDSTGVYGLSREGTSLQGAVHRILHSTGLSLVLRMLC